MRRLLLSTLILVPLFTGCKKLENMVFKTQVETKLEMPAPVSVAAGHVKPVVVQPGQPRGALIDVDGLNINTPFVGPLPVGENPVALFREKLEAAASDPCVKAVVLRVNSHGGGVSACVTMRHDLEQFKARTRLPVVACLMDVACGGAYYLASASDYVVAGPTTTTGGIGVILNLFNLEDLMGLANILPQPIKSGEYTDIATSARMVTPDERKHLEAMAKEYHNQLIAGIKQSRPASANEATNFNGLIFTGPDAQKRGLVDAVGDLDGAIQAAAQLAFPEQPVRPGVVMYRRGNDPARSIYAITANVPLQGAGLFPSVPGIDRAKMPTFLSAWQPEITMERLSGK